MRDGIGPIGGRFRARVSFTDPTLRHRLPAAAREGVQTMRKQLFIIENSEPKYLFINDEGTYAVVTTMQGVMADGTPIVPDGYEDEGEDCTLVGRVLDDTPVGLFDQQKYELPPEALQMIENVKSHREEFSG